MRESLQMLIISLVWMLIDTKEANLERIQVELDKLHEMLMDSDLDAKTDYLTEKPYFPKKQSKIL